MCTKKASKLLISITINQVISEPADDCTLRSFKRSPRVAMVSLFSHQVLRSLLWLLAIISLVDGEKKLAELLRNCRARGLKNCVSGSDSPRIVRTTESVTAKEGENATFFCEVKNMGEFLASPRTFTSFHDLTAAFFIERLHGYPWGNRELLPSDGVESLKTSGSSQSNMISASGHWLSKASKLMMLDFTSAHSTPTQWRRRWNSEILATFVHLD